MVGKKKRALSSLDLCQFEQEPSKHLSIRNLRRFFDTFFFCTTFFLMFLYVSTNHPSEWSGTNLVTILIKNMT